MCFSLIKAFLLILIKINLHFVWIVDKTYIEYQIILLCLSNLLIAEEHYRLLQINNVMESDKKDIEFN